MIDFTSKISLVTGGSRGLGREIVLRLAEYGSDVAFTYMEDKAAADNVLSEVKEMGRRCVAVQADAAHYSRAQQVTSDVEQALGGLHILVCNAGIARLSAVWRMSEADWDDVINVTLKGPFNYIRAAGPTFVQQKYGKIVCIGSINGLRGRLGTVSYNAAKAGLSGLVKTAAAELGQYYVNVNLVAPGYIETPSQTNTPELIRDLVMKECSIKRLGTPQDIVPMVVFLCSDAAHHVTGQIIKVDAGQYL